MFKWNKVSGLLAAAGLGIAAWAAMAIDPVLALGQPLPGQMGLQEPGTDIAVRIGNFYDLVNIIITVITIFVLILLIYVMFRFNERSNPTPSKTTHHVGLEVAWTVIPIAILVVIAIPSFKLLNYQYSYPKPDLTIKAVGNAWYWDHEYLDHKGVSITSNMVTDEDVLKAEIGDKEFNARFGSLEDGTVAKTKAVYEAAKPIWEKRQTAGTDSRQLAVDNEIAVPVGKVVHLLVTSNDVIHSWTIPAFGVKQQAVPGRVSAAWFQPTKTGMFYGQCSVLCGKNHSSMPIAIRVVSEQGYADWIAALKAKDPKKAKAILKAESEAAKPKSVASAETK